MLPEPTLSFTLPSLHDDTVLDCRIYHCQALHPTVPNSLPWKRNAAVVAHPYAPLGGCYDDPIVDIVAGTLLRQGFLVGTFNFRQEIWLEGQRFLAASDFLLTWHGNRGASGSAGRTSWTAKPERSDYMSFVGFMVYYMHFLDPFGPRALRSQTATRSPSPPNSRTGPSPGHPLLLLSGYSYGAMVTTQIPPMRYILSQFKSPAVGSAAADIRLRAQHLAEQQNVILASARAAQSTSPRKKYLGMRVGGDEDSQRRSYDSKRSFSLDAEDKIRRGVNDLLAKTKRHHYHHHKGDVLPEEKEEDTPVQQDAPLILEEIAGLTQVRPAYLLVSPLQGVVTHLATMSFFPTSAGRGLFARASARPREQGAPTYTSDHRQQSETKLVENPTLALFGDKDIFVAVAKLRAWVERMESADGSHFQGVEVASVGHFWTEGKAAHVLRDKVAEFAGSLLQPKDGSSESGSRDRAVGP